VAGCCDCGDEHSGSCATEFSYSDEDDDVVLGCDAV
jgi:hypothetical protein